MRWTDATTKGEQGKGASARRRHGNAREKHGGLNRNAGALLRSTVPSTYADVCCAAPPAAATVGAGSIRRTKSQLLTLPSGSGMKGAVSSWRHLPSTMNLYWWYLRACTPAAGRRAPWQKEHETARGGEEESAAFGRVPGKRRGGGGTRPRGLETHPGGKCTTTANTPGEPSTGAMGTVSTHRVKEPHRWTCMCPVGRRSSVTEQPSGGKDFRASRSGRWPKRHQRRLYPAQKWLYRPGAPAIFKCRGRLPFRLSSIPTVILPAVSCCDSASTHLAASESPNESRRHKIRHNLYCLSERKAEPRRGPRSPPVSPRCYERRTVLASGLMRRGAKACSSIVRDRLQSPCAWCLQWSCVAPTAAQRLIIWGEQGTLRSACDA